MPFLIFAAVAAGLYYFSQKGGITTPSAAAAASPLSPLVTAHAMTVGAVYAFVLSSTLSSDAVVAALANVGAHVDTATLQGDGQGQWSGVFTWLGANGEPTENLPGITWVALAAAGPLAPPGNPLAPATTVVSGWGDAYRNPDIHRAMRASLAR